MNRNTILRRIDGRFLVGMPEPQRAYCPVEGPLRDAVRAVATRLLDQPAPGECDLAVLRNPGSRRLERACAALAPGGALYVEWWHPLPGGAATVHRRLETAGLEQVACYWPWPPPRHGTPQVWLPIDAREAVHWFLGTRPRPPGGIQCITVAIQHLLWRSLWRLGLLAPICTTARKPPSSAAGDDTVPPKGGAEDPGQSLPTILAAHPGAWGLDGTAGGAGCLLITTGQSPRNKLVALIFSSGQREPQIALKMPRVAEAEAGLEREASVLHAVHANGARAGIPRLVARGTIAGRVALAESVVTGRPLLDMLLAETHRTLSLKVTDFLADLAATASPRPSTAWRENVAELALQALSPPERQRARAVLSHIGALPEVCEQRDCSPWNVIVQRDGTIAMLDWESAELRGVPGLDLFYFLTYAGFFVDRTMHTGRELASYRRMLTPCSPTGRVYAECIAAYAERIGLDTSVLEPLRLVCWLLHARSAQLREEGETIGAPADGLLFLELAREELARHGKMGGG